MLRLGLVKPPLGRQDFTQVAAADLLGHLLEGRLQADSRR